MDKRMEEFFDPDAEVEENPEYEKWFDLFAGLSNDDLAKKRSLAAEKSINGAKPTTVELALFPYLFPDAQEYHHTAVSNAQSQGNDAALQGQAPQHAPAVQAEPTPKGNGGNTIEKKPTPVDEFLAELINKHGEGIKQLRVALLDSHDLNRRYKFDDDILTLKGMNIDVLPLTSRQFTLSSRNLSERKKKLKSLGLIE